MPNAIIVDIERVLVEAKNPQVAIQTLAALISAFGAVGILQAPLVGWLQGVLTAILALIVAVSSKTATAAVLRKAARKTAPPTLAA